MNILVVFYAQILISETENPFSPLSTNTMHERQTQKSKASAQKSSRSLKCVWIAIEVACENTLLFSSHALRIFVAIQGINQFKMLCHLRAQTQRTNESICCCANTQC